MLKFSHDDDENDDGNENDDDEDITQAMTIHKCFLGKMSNGKCCESKLAGEIIEIMLQHMSALCQVQVQ